MTGRRSRTTSVITATTDVVISEKSKLELRISDFTGTVHSRMSTIRMGFSQFLLESWSAARLTRAIFVARRSRRTLATLLLQQFARPEGRGNPDLQEE